jgi:Domain of unknown function (DUF4157)
MHDNDHRETLPVARRRTARQQAEREDAEAAELELPRQVGNRAFARHVAGREPVAGIEPTSGTVRVAGRERVTTTGHEAVARSGRAVSLQRAGGRSQGAGPLDPGIEDEIHSAQGSGRPLDDHVRQDMEAHLGTDLSSVRVHADGRGDALSRSVQADAFTTGTDVFFRSGQYAPDSGAGRRLLAHELTHVVQQASGAVPAESRVSHPDDPHEREASAVAETLAARPATPTGLSAGAEPAVGAAVQREGAVEEELEDEEDAKAAVARQATEEELDEDEAETV